MPTLKELLNEYQVLNARIEAARRNEAPSALKLVRETVTIFRFTRTEVFGSPLDNGTLQRPPRFRNSETGETWNGRGPRPAWLRGKDIEQYRISGSS